MKSFRYKVVNHVLKNGMTVDYIPPESILHTEVVDKDLVIWYLEHESIDYTLPLVELEREILLRKKLSDMCDEDEE